ncbi:MAG: glycosyltransferase family 2 protein [Syntrophales bacterium]
MNQVPLVTVITPYYNDTRYFPAALDSYFSQTYPNMEMIVIDDNSSLPASAIIPDKPKYPIRLLKSDKKLGPGGARNLGLGQAQGELIAFLDSDDIWIPTFIEECVKVFSEHHDACWVYSDGYYLIDDKPVTKPNSRYFGFKGGLPTGSQVNEYHLKGYVFELMSANMVRRHALEEVGLFNANLAISEDCDLFCRIAERYPVYAIDKPLIYYRKRSDGFHYSKLENYIRVHTAILTKLYERQGLLPARNGDLQRALALTYERIGIQYLNKNNPQKARYYLMHPATEPIRFTLRINVLRTLSFLPHLFYRLAIKTYDLMI